MRRRYLNFLLTYFHNSSKKAHITKYSIKSTINSTEAKIKLSFQDTTGKFKSANLPGPSSAPSARHVLVRPASAGPTRPIHPRLSPSVCRSSTKTAVRIELVLAQRRPLRYPTLPLYKSLFTEKQ